MDGTKKVCTKCKESKIIAEFGVKDSKRLRSECNTCYAPTKKKVEQTFYEKHGDRIRAEARIKHKENPNKQKNATLKYKYKMTIDEYWEMLRVQDGCAICHAQWKPGSKMFAVDHDHSCCQGQVTCGKCVRGLLCHTCNIKVGQLESILENKTWTERTFKYLQLR